MADSRQPHSPTSSIVQIIPLTGAPPVGTGPLADSRSLELGVSPSGHVEAKRRFYAPELDCLRFAAFLAVFVFHVRFLLEVALPTALDSTIDAVGGAGAFGVDIFFVLSAYLITELLLRERNKTGNLDVRAFYLRRILRIWPLYFFFLGIAFLFPFFDPSQQFGWKYLTGFSFLAGNWAVILLGVPASVAHPLWSVSMEEQFYLCWPPLVKRVSTKGIVVCAILMLLISNLTRLILYIFLHPKNQSIWFNTITRLDPIALGILLAVLVRAERIRLTGLGRLLVFCISCVGLMFVSRYGELTQNLYRLSMVGLFGYPVMALSCLGIVAGTVGISSRLTQNAALIYLGKISYGLYVYHLLGLWIAERAFENLHGPLYGAVCVVAGFCFTAGLAAVSYRLLESPFLELKKRFTYVPSRPV
jgi:peptidoglycan/LPS O-acetylase OafA/YrhL